MLIGNEYVIALALASIEPISRERKEPKQTNRNRCGYNEIKNKERFDRYTRKVFNITKR